MVKEGEPGEMTIGAKPRMMEAGFVPHVSLDEFELSSKEMIALSLVPPQAADRLQVVTVSTTRFVPPQECSGSASKDLNGTLVSTTFDCVEVESAASMPPGVSFSRGSVDYDYCG